MRTLRRHLQFRPHEDRLLTSSAEFWFLSARILVFVMASCEAIAWGYLGFLFGEGFTRWIGAAFAGITIFVVVWMIDVSLITMDRAWREHSAAILKPESAPVRDKTYRDLFTFGLRIALLAGSLTITAPYLAQVVFQKDIERFIDAEATAAIDQSRKQLAATYDTGIEKKNIEIQNQRAALEREVAGKGLSGRYGMGPAAQAMSRGLDKLETELLAAVQEKEEALNTYASLAQDWRKNREQFAATYNVSLPEVSILENRKALEDLRKRPENRSTELAIKAFLAFIFAGLLLLKLFEPNSVRLYLSEVLQQEYRRYKAGTFDLLLPDTEKSNVAGFTMTPQRLYDFLTRVWGPGRQLEYQEADSRAATQSLRALESIRAQIRQDIEQVRPARDVASDAMVRAKRDLDELNSAIAIVEGDIQNYQSRLNPRTATAPLDHEGHLEYEEARLAIQAEVREKLAHADLAMSKLRARHAGIAENSRRAEGEFQILDRKLQDKDAELAEAEKKIRLVRQQAADAASNQARTILSSVDH